MVPLGYGKLVRAEIGQGRQWRHSGIRLVHFLAPGYSPSSINTSALAKSDGGTASGGYGGDAASFEVVGAEDGGTVARVVVPFRLAVAEWEGKGGA